MSPALVNGRLRYAEPEDFFFFFFFFPKSCCFGYFPCAKGNYANYLSGETVSIESGIVSVVSLSTTEISEIT